MELQNAPFNARYGAGFLEHVREKAGSEFFLRTHRGRGRCAMPRGHTKDFT